MSQAVEARGVVKSFPTANGPKHAVRGVDLSIARGEVVALLGPNGAGKSTTIDMLLGLLTPDHGEVSVLGVPPRQAARHGLVGAMLQGGSLIRNVTVSELLSMVAALYRNPIPLADVFDVAGLTEIAGQRTQKLSGGQSQRVRFAVAFVSNPELLILDEPTEALDVAGRRTFWEAMRRFSGQGKTILFATHYLEEADANADRAVLMARGQIVADGPTTEIKGRVGTRTIRATLPGVPEAELAGIAGVTTAQRHGEAITLICSDADAAMRTLGGYPGLRDLEITAAGLEEAFLKLTGNPQPVGEDRA